MCRWIYRRADLICVPKTDASLPLIAHLYLVDRSKYSRIRATDYVMRPSLRNKRPCAALVRPKGFRLDSRQLSSSHRRNFPTLIKTAALASSLELKSGSSLIRGSLRNPPSASRGHECNEFAFHISWAVKSM